MSKFIKINNYIINIDDIKYIELIGKLRESSSSIYDEYEIKINYKNNAYTKLIYTTEDEYIDAVNKLKSRLDLEGE